MNRRDLLKTIPALAVLPRLYAADPAAANKARLHNAICAYSYRDELKSGKLTYADLVRVAVETGADGLDLTVYWMPPDTPDSFLLPLRRLAFKNGVDIYSISIRTEMTREKPEERSLEVAWVQKWVDVAEKLGAGHIRVFGGRVPKGASEDQAAEWATEVLKRAADYSGKKGIILGLENHGGITEKASRILEIVKKADSPWVGVNLDTGNFNSNVMPQIEVCIPHAVNVQVKVQMRGEDGVRQPADWERIVKMLISGGYRGYLALEYAAKEPALTAVPRLTRKLGDIIRQHT